MGPVDSADITVADARALVGGVTALHDMSDLGAMDSAMRLCTAALIPYDAMDMVGAITGGKPQSTTVALDHRLAIRTTGGGPVLIGLVLGRRLRAFNGRDTALAMMLGPLLGAAVDHVRLRATHREQLSALAVLTDRERQVLALVADGRTNREIGDALSIEARTVEKHVEHIRRKLGARSRAEAAARWARAMA
ncbi:MAG: helix-turn-helix transcriptional regulator [Actinomycetota bacterium]|nr:helix-turn-helix transcriptional regulator [Actinomycetota bacterium]